MYAIIDIETTGGTPADRIMEIAIVLHDGSRITGEYTTLINPERNIPYFVHKLTGISRDMVKNAPKFYEVARDIVELTQNRIIVAHNADFDYGFLRKEFRSLGYEFRRKKICTVKLAQRLIPSLGSYNLDRMCSEFGIIVENRHRALGDAIATAKLFEHLTQLYGEKSDLFAPLRMEWKDSLHPALNRNIIEELPESAGVYFFYDITGQLIYIGKSKNIYNRVVSHLSNTTTTKAKNLRDRIADIKYEETGSELVAMLLESHLIKNSKPLFNRLQRREIFNYGIFPEKDEHGYIQLKIKKLDTDEDCITSYPKLEKAKAKMEQLVKQFHLCKRLCSLYEAKSGPCFDKTVGLCKGACVGDESPEEYNYRVNEAMKIFEFESENFFIVDKGKTPYEKSVIQIENKKYIGFGYISTAEDINNLNLLKEKIVHYSDNREVRGIIKSYLKKNKVERIVYY